ncbi:UNVERIFIED_CONTAM: Late blight resistance protein R1-A [Sesamum radiatum]|uniref:Late blight resistance protein R1-A n=1 Tax=Sesamum radiatum TaxID=300843 RepID=A0AAW2PLY7_SESRA
MAVAAYASLLSLMHVLENVQHPGRRHRLHLDRDQIQSLQKKVKFLGDFLEHHSQRNSNQEIEDLVRQIAVVSYEAEHIIDLHVVDQLREGSQDVGHHMAAISSFCQDMDKIVEKIDSITKELMMIKEGWNNIEVQKPIVAAPANSSKIPSSQKNSTMVGFDEHLIRIMAEVAGDNSNLQILPIVGMGGSQKPYMLDFLDLEKSWDLLCEKVFAQKNCPYPEFGKDIAKYCRGLPLAIVVIGGLLANSNMHVYMGLMVLPSRIWEMPQLRHIFINSVVLPFPTAPLDSTILENLQTLALIYNFRCMTKVLERIPNLKKLKLSYPSHVEEWSHYCLYNLARLHKLESLFLSAENFFLENIVFPTALKKLALSRCGIPWKDMKIIGSLLNLEVLKLYCNAFKGGEWNPVDGQFPRLRVLLIHQSDLVRWNAETIHFPNLESLFLQDMHDLEEIPSDIGDIATLCSIHLDSCSDSIVNSAKQILEEQHSNGNELQVWVNGKDMKLVDP